MSPKKRKTIAQALIIGIIAFSIIASSILPIISLL